MVLHGQLYSSVETNSIRYIEILRGPYSFDTGLNSLKTPFSYTLTKPHPAGSVTRPWAARLTSQVCWRRWAATQIENFELIESGEGDG
jgi:hypothetical protein